eukprot:3393325-Rhodomonas_salina.4
MAHGTPGVAESGVDDSKCPAYDVASHVHPLSSVQVAVLPPSLPPSLLSRSLSSHSLPLSQLEPLPQGSLCRTTSSGSEAGPWRGKQALGSKQELVHREGKAWSPVTIDREHTQ